MIHWKLDSQQTMGPSLHYHRCQHPSLCVSPVKSLRSVTLLAASVLSIHWSAPQDVCQIASCSCANSTTSHALATAMQGSCKADWDWWRCRGGWLSWHAMTQACISGMWSQQYCGDSHRSNSTASLSMRRLPHINGSHHVPCRTLQSGWVLIPSVYRVPVALMLTTPVMLLAITNMLALNISVEQ